MVTGTCYVVARRLKATRPIRHEVAAIGPRTDLAWTLRYVAECDPMRTFAKVCCRAGRYSANLCAALLLLQNSCDAITPVEAYRLAAANHDQGAGHGRKSYGERRDAVRDRRPCGC